MCLFTILTNYLCITGLGHFDCMKLAELHIGFGSSKHFHMITVLSVANQHGPRKYLAVHRPRKFQIL